MLRGGLAAFSEGRRFHPHPSDTLPVFSQERVQTPSAQHCQPVGIGHSSSRVETDIAEIDRDSHGQVIPHKASWYDAVLMDMRMPETDGLNAQLAKPSSLRRPVRHAEADAVQASQRRPERPIGLKGRGAHPFSDPASATPPLRPRLRADDKLQAFVKFKRPSQREGRTAFSAGAETVKPPICA